MSKLMLVNLKCELMENPIGMDILKPRLSWEIISDKKEMMQSAYQVIVAESEEDLMHEKNVIWNTDVVATDSSINCEYNGPTLKSKQRYYWKVRIWDENNNISNYSSVAFWEMGLLEESDWEAKWISCNIDRANVYKPNNIMEAMTPQQFDDSSFNQCPYLRKEFEISKEVESARIYVTAHGVYDLFLNGNKVNDNLLAPEYNDYDSFIHYQTYDVTKHVSCGENTFGAILGDGWYSGFIGVMSINQQYGEDISLLMQMEIKYSDGTVQKIVSDESFRSATGPLIYSELYKGEKYDARKELVGWNLNGYNDSNWKECLIQNFKKDNLIAFYGEPIRIVKEFKPKSIYTSPKGETIIDLGQVIAGKFRVKLTGKSGMQVSFTCSEITQPNGDFLMNIMGVNKDQKDIYICKDDKEVIYEPRFTYHGFRYIKVEGYEGTFSVDDFTALVISSDLQQNGEFKCSDNRINKLQSNIFWSQRANFISIPTDCPQREKAGWTGDIQVYASTAAFNMGTSAFLSRWMKSVETEQLEDGQIPMIVPYMKDYSTLVAQSMGTHSSAGWGDACIIVPWVLYNTYGNKRALEDNYHVMKKWVAYIERTASENIIDVKGEMTPERKERQKYLWNTGFHFGDWLAPSLTINEAGEIDMHRSAFLSKDVVAPCFYAYSTELMSKIANILNQKTDEVYYKELNQKIRKAFADEYISEDGTIQGGFQGIYVLALEMNLVPENLKLKVVQKLVDLIEGNGYKLDTGFLSIPFLLDVLYDNGHKDIAYILLFQTECPSWLYEVEKGATTIWEAWQAIKPDGEPTNVSYNHYAFGCVGDFIYRRIGGIQNTEVAYKHISIQPDFECGLTSAETSYKSVHGLISVQWELKDKKVDVKVKVPGNTRATVILPGIREEIGSGEYQYQCSI